MYRSAGINIYQNGIFETTGGHGGMIFYSYGQLQNTPTGNRITRLVLDRDRIGENAVFRIKGYNRSCIAGRLDFVESLLRREAGGITLEEAELA